MTIYIYMYALMVHKQKQQQLNAAITEYCTNK